MADESRFENLTGAYREARRAHNAAITARENAEDIEAASRKAVELAQEALHLFVDDACEVN